MQYWIHIFDDTSTIKLKSIESSSSIWDEAIGNLIDDINLEASSMANGKYIVVLTASQCFKFPATADDYVIQVKKSGTTFSII